VVMCDAADDGDVVGLPGGQFAGGCGDDGGEREGEGEGGGVEEGEPVFEGVR
jgi:hypothetical protein